MAVEFSPGHDFYATAAQVIPLVGVEFSPGHDFYATAAQVIPLLLLALVFETQYIQTERTWRLFQKQEQGTRDPGFLSRIRAFAERLEEEVTGVFFMLVSASIGEGCALVALTLSSPPTWMAGLALLGLATTGYRLAETLTYLLEDREEEPPESEDRASKE